MADITITAGSTRLGALVASPSAQGSGGSAAERAYRRAVKQLEDAQRKLATDLRERAPDEVLELDQRAVELAAAAVQAAAAALAREQQERGADSGDEPAQRTAAGRGRLDVVA